MSLTAPPHRTEGARRVDDAAEALIGEARRLARRRRLALASAAAAAAVVASVIVATAIGLARWSASTVAPDAGAAGAGAGAAAGLGSGELVASMWTHHSVTDDPDTWAYVFDDGRLVSRTISTGWSERRLSTAGVEAVRTAFGASGLFDPEHPVPTGEPEHWSMASLQLRVGDTLVLVRRSVGDGARTLGFDRLARVLDEPEYWLSAEAWVQVEPVPYRPAEYEFCPDALEESGTVGAAESTRALSRAARDILEAAPPMTAPSPGTDLAAEYGDFPVARPGCYRLAATDAAVVADALVAAAWPDVADRPGKYRDGAALLADTSGNVALRLPIPGRAFTDYEFLPVLPHGVVECACLS
ncbi:hypothetical protein GCM10009819_15290 [Agromyces tropicus]|uniref:Uncharacterized protein n=1 Tax=Agromyces tropicus TaxID=555371 RepID=A0ABN2UAB1_9MICO